MVYVGIHVETLDQDVAGAIRDQLRVRCLDFCLPH